MRSRDADVLVPTLTDEIDADLLAQAGPDLKLIANFGNGIDHIDVPAALGPRHHGHQHARRPHRGHRRHGDGADSRRRPPHPGGRPDRPRRGLGRLVADLDAGAADHRQAPRHRRHGPDRPGARAPRQGLRPVDPLPQPPPRAGQDRAGARGDLLGIPRPDARPHGHRVGQLPAHAGDLPPSLGASPEAHEARCHPGEHRARRGDRREPR